MSLLLPIRQIFSFYSKFNMRKKWLFVLLCFFISCISYFWVRQTVSDGLVVLLYCLGWISALLCVFTCIGLCLTYEHPTQKPAVAGGRIAEALVIIFCLLFGAGIFSLVPLIRGQREDMANTKEAVAMFCLISMAAIFFTGWEWIASKFRNFFID